MTVNNSPCLCNAKGHHAIAHCHACAHSTPFRLSVTTLNAIKSTRGLSYLVNTPSCYLEILEGELSLQWPCMDHGGHESHVSGRIEGEVELEAVGCDGECHGCKGSSPRLKTTRSQLEPRSGAKATARSKTSSVTAPSPVERRILFPCGVCGGLTFDGECKRNRGGLGGKVRWLYTPFPGDVGRLVCGRCFGETRPFSSDDEDEAAA